MTTIVNININKKYDVYIGRSKSRFHFGNPFTHLNYGLGGIQLSTREECIQAFGEWLDGTKWQEVEPMRRQWVLDNMHLLKDKVLACWCKPQSCHGDIYIEKLNSNEKNIHWCN